jgi:hypothetical protein
MQFIACEGERTGRFARFIFKEIQDSGAEIRVSLKHSASEMYYCASGAC